MFKSPLKYADLKADPRLAKNWNALRAKFMQRAYRTTPEIWSYLITKAQGTGNRDITNVLKALGEAGPSADVASEEDLENRLYANPALIPGHDLKLVGDGYLGTGRQVSAGGGWIDLLGVDRKTGNYVVVELKAVRAGRNVVGQVMSYVGWVAANLASGSPVEALVISDGVDSHFASAASAIPNLQQVDISALEAQVSAELVVLCGELEQAVHGAVACGTEIAVVPDDEQEVVMGPETVLVDGPRRSSVVAPCHGIAANNADVRFMYNDLEYRGAAWVRFDGPVRGTTMDGVVDTAPFR